MHDIIDYHCFVLVLLPCSGSASLDFHCHISDQLSGCSFALFRDMLPCYCLANIRPARKEMKVLDFLGNNLEGVKVT